MTKGFNLKSLKAGVAFLVLAGMFIPSRAIGSPPTDMEADRAVRLTHMRDLRSQIDAKLDALPCPQPRTVFWNEPMPTSNNTGVSSAMVREMRQVLTSAPFLPNPPVSALPTVAEGESVSANYMRILWQGATDATCGGAPNCGNGTIDFPETCEPPNTAVCDGNCQIVTGGACPAGMVLLENQCFVDASGDMDEGNTLSTCYAYAGSIPPPAGPADCAGPTNCNSVSGWKLRCCYDICSPAASCGNGVIEPGEQCDDSNTTNGDGCSSVCQNEVVTCNNNGTCEPAQNETCANCPGDCQRYTCDGSSCVANCSGMFIENTCENSCASGGPCTSWTDCVPPGAPSECGQTVVHCNTSTGLCFGTFCFPAGTPVSTPNGDRAIESLASGDKVLSWDPEAGSTVVSQVGAVDSREAEDLLELTLSNGTTVTVTSEHPFYDPETKDYRKAMDLKSGDKVLVILNDLSGKTEPAIINKTTPLPGALQTVYNLSVDGELSNYFASGVLVHNKAQFGSCPCSICLPPGPGHPGCAEGCAP